MKHELEEVFGIKNSEDFLYYRMEKKQIPGFPDYWVDQLGRVWSTRRSKYEGSEDLRLLKPSLKSSGYLCVGLCKNGKVYTKLVHRLVLESFVGPCPEGQEGCHNDNNRTNNALSNLRWDTRRGNSSDKWLHGTQVFGSSSPNAKLEEKDIPRIKSLLESRVPTAVIARAFGVNESTVKRIGDGRGWKHVGASS